MRPYTSMANDGQLKPGTYQGKWTGFMINVDDKRHTEVYTDISVTGVKIAVRLVVEGKKIYIYLD